MLALVVMLIPAAVMFIILLLALAFRTVVPTNMVHIVQSRSNTTSYGSGLRAGNVYYKWPHWIPRIGVTTIELPVSNFALPLQGYKAYDRDRVPFDLDVTAFFRIADTNIAAQRVSKFDELKSQLLAILQGSVRKILASHDINQIMIDRATFGEHFTKEVSGQLQSWGVDTVKNIELMDIRDADGSKAIHNIMAMKSSHIEMESRTEVANNLQKAQTAEIEAKQLVDVRKQQADRIVGEQTAEKTKLVGIADQVAHQEILTAEKETQERIQAVKKVELVRQAEIVREQQIVEADQDKQTLIIRAEGMLGEQQRSAEGIRVVGVAKADAEKALQLAPVQAQIELAREIGANEGYQQYLVSIESVKAYIEVGKQQANALQKADVKIISNIGNPTEGMTKVMDLFSSKGGTNVASAVEAMAQTPMGQALLKRLGVHAPAPRANGEHHEA